MGIMVKNKTLGKFLLLLMVYSLGMFLGEFLIDILFNIRRDPFYKEFLTSFFIALILAYATMRLIRKS